MPARLYFVLKYFALTLSYNSLRVALVYNDTVYTLLSMTL